MHARYISETAEYYHNKSHVKFQPDFSKDFFKKGKKGKNA